MIKKIFPYYKKHLGLFILDMCCATAVALCNLFYPTITRKIIDVYIPSRQLQSFIIWIAVLVGIFSFKCILNYIIGYYGHLVGVYIQSDLRKDLFRHLQRLPVSYYDDNKTGQIMSRIVNDLFEVAELCHHGPEDVILSVLTIIGSIILIGTINWWLALIVLVVIPFLLVLIIATRKELRYALKLSRERTADINSDVENSLLGIKITKSYTAEKHEEEKFNKSNESFVEAKRKGYKVLGKFHSIMTFLMDLFYLIALFSGGMFFYYGKISVGDLAAFLLYISVMIAPIRTFMTIYEQLQNGLSGFSRFCEIMDIPEEYQPNKFVSFNNVVGNVEFKNVTFSYTKENSKDSAVIKNLDLKINAGKTIALVGPSGGGKTTLCNLIPRFYRIDEGEITIDGINIENISSYDLRKNIAIVSQDVFLFTGSIKDNIAYGNPEASEEEILKAAKLANVDDFVNQLKDGYDTYIGERGVKLSGGQKQRISIARAFLKNPPILILDEATSALDNITEMQIQKALEELSKGRTTIVVAHRLSTIKNADEIIVITADGIGERGKHSELLKGNGLYAKLYSKNFEL